MESAREAIHAEGANCPFQPLTPASPPEVVGREADISALLQRAEAGESCLLVGEPRSGKTSALRLAGALLARREGDGTLAVLVDAGRFEPGVEAAQVWEALCRPLQRRGDGTDLGMAHQLARQYGFSGNLLQSMLHQARKQGLRLVALIDDFDALLRHNRLIESGFFADLCQLTAAGAISILATSRLDRAALDDRAIRKRIPTFDAFPEQILGPLSAEAVERILNRAGNAFSREDHAFAQRAAGGNPYLVQVIAAALWEAAEGGRARPVLARRHAGGRALTTAENALGQAWRTWSPAERWAALRVALAQVDVPPLQPLSVSGYEPLQRLFADLAPPELRLLVTTLAGADAPMQVLPDLVRNRGTLSDALSLLLEWRPEHVADIGAIAVHYGLHLADSAGVQAAMTQLQRRGVLAPCSPEGPLALRAEVALWWLLEQLQPLARQDIDIVHWLRLQGMVPPAGAAFQHLAWRLDRLQGQLMSGSSSLIHASAAL